MIQLGCTVRTPSPPEAAAHGSNLTRLRLGAAQAASLSSWSSESPQALSATAAAFGRSPEPGLEWTRPGPLSLAGYAGGARRGRLRAVGATMTARGGDRPGRRDDS
jgi:hypothetical protein